MNKKQINTLLKETAYVRESATEGELKSAEYLKEQCEKLGVKAELETFEVDGDIVESASLTADGRSIPCTGYRCSGNGDVEAELYYMPGSDRASIAGCKGKIVMTDGGMTKFLYQDILEAGAVGFITYNGDIRFPDHDIDRKELRSYVSLGKKLPGVNIHVSEAVRIIGNAVKRVHLTVKQKEMKAESRNVVAVLPGERKEFIAFTAHYDSVPLSVGSYDNMSGCIGLLGIMEKAIHTQRRLYSMRFIFCGSEERGLLGSKTYTVKHEEELKDCVLCINLDMIGSVMGKFIACVSGPDALVQYLKMRGCIKGFGINPRSGVYSSDSTPFADKGVPSLSFARLAPGRTATIHNRYDTPAVMSSSQTLVDIDFITDFSMEMVNAAVCPVERVIPDSVKKQLDEYLGRKRKED